MTRHEELKKLSELALKAARKKAEAIPGLSISRFPAVQLLHDGSAVVDGEILVSAEEVNASGEDASG